MCHTEQAHNPRGARAASMAANVGRIFVNSRCSDTEILPREESAHLQTDKTNKLLRYYDGDLDGRALIGVAD